jgi:hypothetical protein
MPTTYEKQEDQGGKIELFRFTVTTDAGATSYLYAGAGAGPEDVERTIGADDLTFVPVAISQPELATVKAGQEDEIEFDVPWDNAVAMLNIDLPHPARIGLTIYHTHYGDPGTDTVWTGRVAAVTHKGLRATIRGESYLARIQKRGLQYECGTGCNYTPYNLPCPLTRAANDQTLTVTAGEDTNVLTVTGYVGDLTGGEIKTANGDGRDIQNHSGGTLTLYAKFPLSSLEDGDTVTAYPSCDLTFTGNARSCDTFAETDDGRLFGGYPHTPPEGADPQEHGLS